MKNEKVKYLLFREQQVQDLIDAIITKQNCIGDLKNGIESWDNELQERSDRLESILKQIITTAWCDLPEPNATFVNDLDNNSTNTIDCGQGPSADIPRVQLKFREVSKDK